MGKGVAEQLPPDKYLVLFDGYCNLCNGAVQFIIKRDPKEKFYFSSLSWPPAQELIAKNPEYAGVDSILLLKDGRLYAKSDAALHIAKELKGAWPALSGFRILPQSFRNFVYDVVARNRYRWFGKKDTCMIPEKDMNYRFLGGD